MRQRNRLTKDLFVDVLSLIKIERQLSTSVPAALELEDTLPLLPYGNFQYSIGDDFLLGMVQSTICKIVNHITEEI